MRNRMLAMPENEAEHLQSHCMRVGLSIAPAVVASTLANTCLYDAMMGFSRGKEKGKIALQTYHLRNSSNRELLRSASGSLDPRE